MKDFDNQFTKYHKKELEKVTTYLEASKIALEIISKMPQPIGQVCGPITNGGENSLEKNLEIFGKTILKLQAKDKIIFNQLNFEPTLRKILNNDDRYHKKRNIDLLNQFYGSIFSSQLIQETYFIYGWENSFGTKWEHEKIIELGLNCIYLPKDFLQQ